LLMNLILQKGVKVDLVTQEIYKTIMGLS